MVAKRLKSGPRPTMLMLQVNTDWTRASLRRLLGEKIGAHHVGPQGAPSFMDIGDVEAIDMRSLGDDLARAVRKAKERK